MDENETNGFEVDLDSEAILSCVVSTSGSDDKKKHNTCFTSGTVFLQRGSYSHFDLNNYLRLQVCVSCHTYFCASVTLQYFITLIGPMDINIM